MKKGVKKGLLIGSGVFVVLLAILISIPFLFKDKIKEAVVSAANSSLNAELHVNDFGISIFPNFPNITLSLQEMSISGIGDFAGDTLLKAKSADVTLNIIQVLKGNYEVSKINMDGATVYAKILTDGRANWDIVKVDSTKITPEKNKENEKASSLKLKLQKVSLDNCLVTYEDQQSNMKVILSNWSGEVSGDFSANNTTIKTKSTIDEISFVMDGVPYLSKIKGTANATLDADMDKIKFTFVESDIQLNDVKASIDGSVALVGEDGKDFDLKLKVPDTQFKDILSILPAMYTEDFKSIKTAGTASLDGFVKGLMQGDQYPAFNFRILINNAMFQYPSLPKSVDNINVDMSINSKGGSFDNTIIDISKFDFTMAGNPFSASLNIQTPMSDANLKAHLKGIIDLAMIKDVYPLDKGTELNGKLTADLNIAARMSAIEKEQYQNVNASGSLKLNNMTYKSGDMQDVIINSAELGFTPQYVNLSSLDVKIGKNDISATGRLENFIAYALKDQTLKGQLNLKSNYFNLNDFMGDSPATPETTSSKPTSGGSKASTTQASDNFVVPTNINFAINADMKQVVYQKVNITNLKGSIAVNDGTITMQDVTGNALGGTANISGSYSTAADPKNPKITLNANISKASFAETFKSVETIQKFAPVFDKVLGNYSMNMKMNASMSDNLLQMLSGLTASGLLQANDVQVEGVEALNKLSSSLKTDALKSFSAKDVSIPFTIDEGKINTKPFTVGIGDGGKLNLSGTTGLDQTINYKGTITLPKSMANAYINNIPITIGGTFSDPKIGIDAKSLIGNLLGGDAAEKVLGGSIADKKEEITAKVGEEKAKQIQKLRDEAKTAGDKLIEESQKKGQQLVSAAEPKGAIAKLAAQTAADKMVSEAKKNAKKMTDEAEVQIKKLEAQ